jgi:hypothetical protein
MSDAERPLFHEEVEKPDSYSRTVPEFPPTGGEIHEESWLK